jgi:ATP-dependent DNA helicase RecG
MPLDHSEEFIASLPFTLTGAQKRAVADCMTDMRDKKSPMNRLIQGDVGSGKTAVCAAVCDDCVYNGYQAAFMAPTDILARQHYETFARFFDGTDVRIELLTGSMTPANKRKVRERIENGEIDIVIGTHALLSESTVFKSLGVAITDEQHRFGVAQRAKLASKGEHPHLLVLSATPIPRTLGLIIYGDLDVTIIDELPPGRTEVQTVLIGSEKRERALNFIKKQADEGRQCYIVCPLVEEGEGDLDLHNASDYAAELMLGVLRDYPVGLLHGKMKAAEKDAVMDQFSKGELSILVATTVVEVGVDVKNATVMMIENAERFGLSTLHQLRGRVGRGEHKSYCILVSDHMSDTTQQRLSTMCRTNDGFEIADMDLKLRGPGDFFGNRQHGLPQLNIADFSDSETLAQSQEAAQEILRDSPDLSAESTRALRAEVLRLFDITGDALN